MRHFQAILSACFQNSPIKLCQNQRNFSYPSNCNIDGAPNVFSYYLRLCNLAFNFERITDVNLGPLNGQDTLELSRNHAKTKHLAGPYNVSFRQTNVWFRAPAVQNVHMYTAWHRIRWSLRHNVSMAIMVPHLEYYTVSAGKRSRKLQIPNCRGTVTEISRINYKVCKTYQAVTEFLMVTLSHYTVNDDNVISVPKQPRNGVSNL